MESEMYLARLAAAALCLLPSFSSSARNGESQGEPEHPYNNYSCVKHYDWDIPQIDARNKLHMSTSLNVIVLPRDEVACHEDIRT